MIARGQNFKQIPLNICGSSTFGRYPKISAEKTINMFMSDNFMVPYSGYNVALEAAKYFSNGLEGRGIYTSTILNEMIVVIGSGVYSVTLKFNNINLNVYDVQVILLGNMTSSSGKVYIAENNKPQIAISDGINIYIYDPNNSPTFKAVPGLDFIPGYITFHDTYFICAAFEDNFYTPVASNTWRLSASNNGLNWPNLAANIGLIQTKPDVTQAVLRFPSKGNMIFVMGENVTEAWFDIGAQLFPYQRQDQFNIDYGCLNPATVAYMDEIAVWLGQNEKSGPVILYSDGGMPTKVTTDGIDYFFSQLTEPADSQAFLYRQDGHLFYHINFYTDNVSLFIDFLPDGSHKIYHACDQNGNYFIAAQVAFYNNQYYFVSKNTGNLYTFDTIFTTYQDTQLNNNVNPPVIVKTTFEIPRSRICRNIRFPSQEYFIANDVGFTIETGETNYQENSTGDIFIITQDGHPIITQGGLEFIVSQDNNFIVTQDGQYISTQQTNPNDFSNIIAQQQGIIYTTPHVDLSVSRDGGESFGSDYAYNLFSIGKRKNKLMWWQCGSANDFVCQFKFWGMGRFVATDGLVNIRQ